MPARPMFRHEPSPRSFLRRLPLAAYPLLLVPAGIGQALSLAVPGLGQPLDWLQLLSLAVLCVVLDIQAGVGAGAAVPAWARRAAIWRGAWAGGLFATAWLCGTFWWLFISMHTYGGLAAPFAGLAVFALAAFLALYYAAAGAAFVAFAPAGPVRRALLFVALWTLAELLRGSWFTGFPWGAGGYAHVDGILGATARLVGVYGTGALAAWVVCMVLLALRGPALRTRVLALALLVPVTLLVQAGRQGYSQGTGTLEVALLQGNIPQDEKFQPGTGVADALRWYGERLRDATAPLVVAPETALPVLPQQLPAGYWDALRTRFAEGGQAALIGVPLGSMREGYTNSVVGFAPPAAGAADTPLYRYDKHHLVPFGEFIPMFFRWFTELMNIPLGDFNRGAVGQASFAWQGQRLAPNICYEDLFGDELGARFADAAQAPTVFVNVSNIGWFDDSVAIDQHLLISRLRAIEFERPMIRATNTGATALIDHEGRVQQVLPRLTRGTLAGSVEGRSGLTPYAWWVSRWGLAPLWVLCVLVVAVAVVARRRASAASWARQT